MVQQSQGNQAETNASDNHAWIDAAMVLHLLVIFGFKVGRPWNGVDPIVVASQIVLGLQTIVSRQVDVTQAPSIVTVGRISGVVRNNVFPDSVEMEGTIRTFDEAMSYGYACLNDRPNCIASYSANSGSFVQYAG